MGGGKVETDPINLAESCGHFMTGAKSLFDAGPNRGDMWFFELFHHLDDCAAALRRLDAAERPGEQRRRSDSEKPR